MISDRKRDELHRNYEVFMEALPALLPEHEDQFVLMRHGKLIAYFNAVADAVMAGRRNYEDDLFSVQIVRRVAADFGWYSRAPGNETI